MSFTNIPEAQLMAYDPRVYETVTDSLHKARDKLAARDNAQDILFTEIRDCFIKHDVHKNLSACLLHRHYDLEDDERNVEQHGQAIASKDTDVYPSSWMFADGKLYPYEFKRYPVDTRIPAIFADEYSQILKKHNLEDLFGFQVYTDGIVGHESTDHDTNVSTTIDIPENEYTMDPDMAPASWAFFS